MKIEDRLIIELTSGETADRSLFIGGIDWGYLFQTGRANRVQGLIFEGLDRNGLLQYLPEKFIREMEDDYFRDVIAVRSGLEIAGRLSGRFGAAEVPLIILRGLALGLTVYPRPFLRIFSDLDLLVPEQDLARARKLLREEGFRPVPGLLPDRYFERHHLHLAYLHPASGLQVELHWAFDHPFTLSLVEYPGLFARRRPASFEGKEIPVLAPEDRILTLSLHLIKHCPFLPELLEEKHFSHLFLRGRWLLWLIDLRRTLLKSGEELDWDTLAGKARRWHLERETAACLQAVAVLYGDGPGRQFLPLSRSAPSGALRRELYRRQLLYLQDKPSAGRLTRVLFELQEGTIFRPVRLLDLPGYLFPGSGWLKKRYRVQGRMVFLAAVRHTASAVLRILGNLLDYLYYRYRPC